jgi:hypothetical protein
VVTLTAVLALALALPVLAGCGSSGDGWHEFAKRTASGTEIGAAGGTVTDPAAVRVEVEAEPDVATQVSYSIDCSGGRHTQTGVASGRTPFTARVPLPGGPGPCSVTASASKSAPAEMTVTLSARPAPGHD